MNTHRPEDIAIVGMAGRFPQAANLTEFWTNLREGREAVTFFDEDQAEWLPFEEPPPRRDPRFVPARAALERPEWFDAEFFQFTPREAAMMDPQQRVFLECAWEALEDAGCNPDRFPGLIGVFAGTGANTYLLHNLVTNPELVVSHGLFPTLTLNEKDYLASRVAYKLNLRGPALSVQTACSTSLVAVCLACQSLLQWSCDVALAGGVSITFPVNRGHQHLPGGIMSADGHCRTFDAAATGTVDGSGAGVVVLKRLHDALEAGDTIRAVIRGYAMNNDGHGKIGFTAPSIDGQAECIAMAQAMAEVDASSIGYVEAHGTGTPLGDPIEVAALAKAFGGHAERGSCALGSVKTNIGHTDVAAGVAGLIKTVLALEHGEIPPTLHYRTANPEIAFADTPFFVNDELRPWPRTEIPRRAGVSSFGIGGTNAHVVLEEAPAPEPAETPRGPALLVLSGRTEAAVATAAGRLADHLEAEPDTNLADIAFTLQTGRKAFAHRRAVVARDVGDAINVLRTADPERLIVGRADGPEPKVAFLFPGQGAQSVNMARELYEAEPAFREDIDRSCAWAAPRLGLNLRPMLFPPQGGEAELADAMELLRHTRITQPALFLVEHALATQWIRWGIRPAAMLGHSLGEYVAACLAGVFTLEEGLALVIDRARWMQELAPGAMLAIRAPEPRVVATLDGDVAVAAVNAPAVTIVSGTREAIDRAETKIAAAGLTSKRLATLHAFHSAMVDPVIPRLEERLREMDLRPPQIPWISNVTGTWVTEQQATSPEYWATQMRRTVRFADGVGELLRGGFRVLLEVGPGHTLTGLARQHPAAAADGVAIAASLDHPTEGGDAAALLGAMAQLWAAGVEPDWEAFHAGQRRHRVPLPTYPFERTRCWIEPGTEWMRAPGRRQRARPPEPEAPPATSERSSDKAPAQLESNDPLSLALRDVTRVFAELAGADIPLPAADRPFAHLGFDSLFLAQASVALGRELGVDVAFRQLRDEFGTLRKLALHVARQAVFAGPVTVEESPRARDVEILAPVTPAQREIWMACQLGTGAAAAYHESATLDLAGPLDLEALRGALAGLVARHDALRTRFLNSGDGQIIAPTGEAALVVLDADGPESAAACLYRELHRPFDLYTGPLFRPALVRIDDRHHRLALIVHHLVCDGWSLGILVRELGELYAASLQQRPPTLRPAPRFSEHALRNEDPATEDALAEDEAYWAELFHDGIPSPDLPTDRPRPANRDFAGDLHPAEIPAGLAEQARQFSREHDVTVFTTLLTVFTLLLHRLSGQDDLVIGVPTAGQALEGNPDLVGHFANLVPLRSRLEPGLSFAAHLERTRRTIDEALTHGRYPFGRLLQLLRVPRDASQAPLTPVLFNTTHQRASFEFGEARASVIVQPKRFIAFDLNLLLAKSGATLTLGCYHRTDLWDAATIERWLHHYETLLRGCVATPDLPVADIPLLTPAERHQLIAGWNSDRVAYPHDACVHTLFEQQVARTPAATALIAGDERLTYAELNRRADEMAVRLRAAGVRPGRLVGVLLERTSELVVAILAVLKAGGAYVPMDPAHPRQRLAFIAADAELAVVLTQQELLSRLPALLTPLVFVESAEPAAALPTVVPPDPDHLAYVMYTSGSTGQPKGVCVPHRAVAALTAWARGFYTDAELRGVLCTTSTTFDVSVFETLVPLCLGGTVILAPSLFHVGSLPAAKDATLLSGVPSLVAELLRSGGLPRSVHTVNLAGERCPQALVDALYAAGVKRVCDLYGPTETTVYSTGGVRLAGDRPTIGRVLPNEQAFILDARRQPVPIGVAGELYLGGDKLARGYRHRPELTAERFIPHPFLAELALATGTPGADTTASNGARVYRTGDAARFLPDGRIEFLGRLDQQVKIRGCRVEPGEVEATLCEHPAIAEAVVAAAAGADGGPQLVAYVVPREGESVTAAAVREHAAHWLPASMVPGAVVVLDSLPRTTSGKIDHHALPAPELDRNATGDAAPHTETEHIVARIWGDVLGLEPIGVEDNFFALGGNSLHATRVLARLQESFGVELTLRQFFSNPTIVALASSVEAELVEQLRTADPDIAVVEP